MYQLQFSSTDEGELRQFVESAKARLADGPDSKVLFHLYADTGDRSVTDRAASIVREAIPDALIVGCSTNGNICDGLYSAADKPVVTAICSVFEHPRAKLEVHQFPFDAEHASDTAEALMALVGENPWVKAIEMLTTVVGVSMADFCADISGMRADVVVFGGAALTPDTADIYAGLPYVFSSAGGNDGHAIVFVLYGGEGFHACTQAVFGWKPLGKTLAITKAEGPVVYELDGKPAFERYHHYLSIENDESFAQNSLIFPLVIMHDGRSVIKTPAKVGEDGSLMLSSDLASYHRQCRIAYGDPATILRSIKESASAMSAFDPQGILCFSCAARLSYWGPDYVRCETLPFQRIAPSAGFYTGGEIERHKGKVLYHNVTLVIVGIREGDATVHDSVDVSVNEVGFNRQMAIVNSLAAFVGVTSAELEAAYKRMEQLAKYDGLTGIANRREIQAAMEAVIRPHGEDPSAGAPCVIMIDLDDFKKVNDTYGHKAGDDVLRTLGGILRQLVDDAGIGRSGRWGGEEFVVVLPQATLEVARALARQVGAAFAAVEFAASGRHTLSAGVAQAVSGESPELLCMRADKALYAAKKQGKNRVVVD